MNVGELHPSQEQPDPNKVGHPEPDGEREGFQKNHGLHESPTSRANRQNKQVDQNKTAHDFKILHLLISLS